MIHYNECQYDCFTTYIMILRDEKVYYLLLNSARNVGKNEGMMFKTTYDEINTNNLRESIIV